MCFVLLLLNPHATIPQMWREAFQSVADDIDRLSHDVEKRVAHDPLASIGMPRPAARKPASSSQAGSASGKGSETSPPGDNNSSSVTKRRREADKEREEQEAAAAAATDPFARRRTRPKSYWAVGNETKSTEVRYFIMRKRSLLRCGTCAILGN